MADVIREDIVKVGWDIDSDPLFQLQKEIDNLKKQLSGGLGDDAFDDLKDSVDDSNSSMGKAKRTAEELKRKLSDLGKKGAIAAFNGLKKVASISFKALTVGIGAAATAVGALVTNASSAYAEYEQLVGGVDTLFKGASKDVQKNANDAYKTAGISANKYMETVTSFSASMIQSVGGDTKKAAQLSDMAIRDMSDNANKMGTSMDSIMETYQSLARGNYMMLDNLKLGYGGTKEELKRLIKDASKLDKSVDANSLSYANIAKAIHAVQQEMGITGTTSKEAEGTITGSLASVKATWQNLMPALIQGGDVFDKALDNFIQSTKGFGNNIIPTVRKALVGVGNLVEGLAPIIEKEFPTLVDELLPPLLKAGTSLLKAFIKALPSLIKTVIRELPDIFKQLGGAIGEAFGEIPILSSIGKFFSENGEKITKFIPVIVGLVGAFMLFNKIKSIGSIFSGLFGGSKGGADGAKGGMFGGLANLAKMKTTSILKGMANLAIIIGGFTVLAIALMAVSPYLADIGDTASIIKMIAIIGVLGVVGGVLTKFAGIAGNMPISTALKGIANMAIIFTGMTALFLLVNAVSNIPFDFGRVASVIAIIGLLGTIATVLTVFGGIVGLIPISIVATGLANMAIIMAGMSALFLLIGATSMIDFDYKKIMKIIGIIALLGTVGSILTVFAGIIGLVPIPVVLAGLANIALVLGGMTALIIAYGALAKVKGLTEFIEKGGELLAKLFNIIGKIAGSLIGGFGEGVTSSLPTIGKNLSDFATSIKPMFSAFSGVDMSGVGDFFEAMGKFMLTMAGGNVLSFLTGKPDFSGLAKGLNTLATSEGVKKFFNMVNSIEEGAFNKGKLFFECIDGVSNLPNVGGLAEMFGGKNDFSGVAKGLGTLATEGVKNFFAMVAGMEQVAFDNAKLFFECMDDVKALPNSGGLSEMFGGKNDFSGVAKGLTDLSGEGVKNFFAMVASFDESTFTKTTALFKSLSDINNVGGKEGFWEKLGNLFGGEEEKKSPLTTVAEGLSSFANKTKEFFAQVNSLNIEKLNGLWNSLKGAETLSADISKAVDDNIADIVTKISNLPTKMGDALKNAGQPLADSFVEVWKEAVKASVKPVNKLLDGANHILKEFGSKKSVIEWQPYAKGTDGHKGGNALVNDGRGAELVQMPNGNAFIPKGRNVFIPNAPIGMRVLSAENTANLMGRNSPTFRYKDGIGDIDIWSYYDNAKGLVDKLVENISYEGMNGFASSIGKSMVSTFAGEMPAWVKKLFEENGQSIASYVSSKGVTQWLPTVVRALKMEGQYNLLNVARTLFQMKTESGGNPMAINLWDSNAKKGIPSKGLMQVIDPTFRAYARKGFDKNIYDPLSNILASIRYAVSRYGSLARAYRGKGYENGGIATSPSIFGENGAEMAIPLKASKRKRGLSLWAKTGEMFGLGYSPENDSGNYASSVVEYNTYSPQLSFVIEGSNDDRTLERRIKRVAKKAIVDMIDEIERNNPKTREV